MSDETVDVPFRPASELLTAGAGPSSEALSHMRDLFEAIAARFSRKLDEIYGAPIQTSVESVDAHRGGDAVDGEETSPLAALCRVAGCDAALAIAVDDGFVLALLEAMFGSGAAGAADLSAYHRFRPMTRIEQDVGRTAVLLFVDALSATCGEDFTPMEFEQAFDVAAHRRKLGPHVTLSCGVTYAGAQGRATIVAPRILLDRLRQPDDRAASDAYGLDAQWSSALKERLMQTEVTVRATMDKRGLTLADVSQLKVGQVICLPFSPNSLIRLECEGRGLFWCALGQKDGYYSVRIDDYIDDVDELAQTILDA